MCLDLCYRHAPTPADLQTTHIIAVLSQIPALTEASTIHKLCMHKLNE
jgi:hypothetical protein